MAYRTTVARMDRDHALRAHILSCALKRVSDGGFAALTMQALAEDAGIATGSLYRHFQNKGEIAVEVFRLASQCEVELLAAAFNAPGHVCTRLRQGLSQFAARAWHSRRLAFALIAEPVEPAVDEQRLFYREAYAELFAQLLDEGVQAGHFHLEHTHLVAACLVGAIAESLIGPLSPPARAAREAGHHSLSLEAVTQSLTSFCLRAIGASEIHL